MGVESLPGGLGVFRSDLGFRAFRGYRVSQGTIGLYLSLSPAFLGFLIMISLYESLKGRLFGVKVWFTSWEPVGSFPKCLQGSVQEEGLDLVNGFRLVGWLIDWFKDTGVSSLGREMWARRRRSTGCARLKGSVSLSASGLKTMQSISCSCRKVNCGKLLRYPLSLKARSLVLQALPEP